MNLALFLLCLLLAHWFEHVYSPLSLKANLYLLCESTHEDGSACFIVDATDDGSFSSNKYPFDDSFLVKNIYPDW